MRGVMVLSIGLFCAHSALAQPEVGQVNRPSASERVVRVFDFEEPDNPLPVPQYWVRGQNDPLLPRIRPGFPAWNGAQFDAGQAHSGQRSIYLPTQGGSTSLLLRSGVLPVLPGADYRVSAWVKTDRLEQARAFIAARVLDESGQPIPGHDSFSRPISSEDDWALSDAIVSAGGGAYLQLELLVLQPEQYIQPQFDFPELTRAEDVHGGAWFDDLMVVQLPQTDMSTGAPGNLTWGSTPPNLHVEVRDLTGDDLSVVVRVFAIDGTEIDRKHVPFEGGRVDLEWQPRIERYGWYRASVEISAGSRVVGSDFVDFGWVVGASKIVAEPESGAALRGASNAPGGGSADRSRFGVIVQRHHPDLIAQLPEVAVRMGVGLITLPAWWDFDTQDPGEQVDLMMPVIRAMRGNHQRVSIMFDRLPAPIAGGLGIEMHDVLGFFSSDPARYGPLLRPMLDRLGQMVRRWQIGGVNDEALTHQAGAVDLLQSIDREVRRPVPEAELALPWPIELPDPTSLLGTRNRVTLLSAAGPLEHHEAAALAEQWRSRPGDPLHERSVQLVLECEDAGLLGYQACAEAMARTMIEAWAALGPRHDSIDGRGGELALVEPWTWTSHRRPRLMPRPEAVVMRNLVERLADRTATGEIQLAPGVRCILLEPRAGAAPGRAAALAVWAEPHARTPQALSLLLGVEDLTLVDLYGNASNLPRTLVGELHLPTHEVPVGSAPVFVEGVDAGLVRFIHALQLDPAMLSARNGGGRHNIVLENPWSVPLRGELYIVEPGGFSSPNRGIDRSWQIDPRVIPFAIDPGERVVVPIDVIFSPFEEAGPRDFVFDVELTAEREYGTIRINRPVEIGAPGLRMRVSYRLGPGAGGPHVFVDADVMNTGPEPVTFRLTAQASGFPRDSASITALAPRQTARRTFVFPEAAEKLSGLSVYVSLSVPESDIRLNGSVPIE
ncbi:MAG: hypothetical protein DYG94_04065 [Leptolyngbya sp. PLA3]|nr:hypothetical protein [Leptolyngbya sp. PL-A3]